VRLQQWGEWIAYEDQSESARGKQFWYNHLTQETQWDMPRDVQLLQGRAIGYVHSNSVYRTYYHMQYRIEMRHECSVST
jgi:hypothetical protein